MVTTPGVQITGDYAEPYFKGATVEVDDFSMPVSLDGRGFTLDLENPTYGWQFSRRSVNLINTQQATSGLDQSVTSPEVWRRLIDSWHQGGDQERFDRADSLPYRFHASLNIDPWEKFGFSLLNKTTVLQTVQAGLKPKMKSIGKTLLVVAGTVANYYATVGTAAVAHSLPALMVDVASDGENFYVLCADGAIVKRDGAGVWSTVATVPTFDANAAMLAYVKGFLIVGTGPSLWDYTNPAAPVLIFTHRLSDWVWREAAEGLPVIYILGGIGDRWHVHRISIKSTGAGLDPPIVACTLPDGEWAYSLATYLGYVLIGVNSGWRFAMPDSSGALTYGQLIETTGPVLCFEGQDRFVWFGMSMISTYVPNTWAETSTRNLYTEKSGLGRCDLSTFVAPMTPAAASDLTGEILGSTTSVVSVGDELDGYGKRVFAVAATSGAGAVYVESDDLCESGWLTSGTINFNSGDSKMGLYAQVYHEPLVGEIHVDIANDRTLSFVALGFNNREGSVSLGNIPYPKAFNAVELRYFLYRSATDAKAGPRVTRSEFRAINVPGRATEWRIPVFVVDDINYRNTEKSRDVVSDYDFLMDLVTSRRQFAYREADRNWLLHATDFVWMPNRMTADGRTYQGTFMLTAREVQ